MADMSEIIEDIHDASVEGKARKSEYEKLEAKYLILKSQLLIN